MKRVGSFGLSPRLDGRCEAPVIEDVRTSTSRQLKQARAMREKGALSYEVNEGGGAHAHQAAHLSSRERGVSPLAAWKRNES